MKVTLKNYVSLCLLVSFHTILFHYYSNCPCPSCSSWFVTMQICVASFQSWRNVFGLLLRELRPWRLHWEMLKKAPWWTAGATSRRLTVSRMPWGQRMLWDAPMQHRSVIAFSVCFVITVYQVPAYLTLYYQTDSQASETEAAARLLPHQPVLHLYPRHWTCRHLQQLPVPKQHDTAKTRQHQLQHKLRPEQHVSQVCL